MSPRSGFARGRAALIPRLLSLAALLSLLLGSSGQGAPASAQSVEVDDCIGDERISFAPNQPAADEELLVAVSSSRQHRGVWLAGSERPVFVREYPGQLGWVWNWTVVPTVPGPLRVQFFVDSTVFCAEATVLIGPSAHPGSAGAAPAPIASLGLQPSAEDGDNGDNSGDNGGDNQDNSHQLSAPRISSVDPTVSCAGARFTIRGRNFGSSRGDVDGKAIVAGVEVRDYLSWQGSEVIILVPSGATIGPGQDVYLITAGGFAHATVTISASPC